MSHFVCALRCQAIREIEVSCCISSNLYCFTVDSIFQHAPLIIRWVDLSRPDLKAMDVSWQYTAYSKAYVPEEATAKQQHVGVWDGKFQEPWEYRKMRRVEQRQAREARDFVKEAKARAKEVKAAQVLADTRCEHHTLMIACIPNSISVCLCDLIRQKIFHYSRA